MTVHFHHCGSRHRDMRKMYFEQDISMDSLEVPSHVRFVQCIFAL